MNEEAETLIQWFTGRELPTGHFIISKWESTDNLSNTIKLAIENVRGGNSNSLTVLKRIRQQVETVG